jgi:hypothetical protein
MESYAPLATRQRDLILPHPFDNQFTFRYTLPPGMAAASPPAPARREGAFGSWSVSTREEGGTLIAEARLQVAARRIAAADYPAFREFLSGLDRALLRTVRLTHAVGSKP